MYPFLNIGPFAIPSKPFFMIIGIYVSLWLLEKIADQFDIEPAWLSTAGTNSIMTGVIGSRLIFAATHWEAIWANPLSLLWPITVGYSLWGAILVGLLSFFYFGRQAKLPIPKLLDAITPSLLILICAWILGDFFGGPGFGKPANLARLNQHPVQIYEVTITLLSLAIWWIGRPQRTFDGWLFLITTASLSAGLLLTLSFRGGGTVVAGWPLNQLSALISMVLALGILTLQSPKEPHKSLTTG